MINRIYGITLLLLAILLPTTAVAYDFEVDGIYYNINGNEATVTYKGEYYWDENTYSGDVTIPATTTYNGMTFSVTEIGDYAFSGCSGLTNATIPNSITAIGNGAFSSCSGLTSITIPNSVTELGHSIFIGCSGLTNISLGNSLTSIQSSMFWFCTSLISVDIPNSITEIAGSAFYGCTSLASITVADDNPKYDSRNNCNAIIETETDFLIIGCKNTIIPNSVTMIFFSAFSGCSSLTSIIIPNSVTYICDDAFYDCSGLTNITIPNSVTEIGSYAFDGCSGLTSVTCLSSIPPKCYNAFPDEVTSQATLYVPEEYLEDYKTANNWKDFSNILAIEFEVDGIYYLALTDSTAMVITKPGGDNYSFSSVTIPETVTYNGLTFSITEIGEAAFSGCSELSSITIPNTVTSIGANAFDCCSGLTSITIPNSVTEIGHHAFVYCSGLTNIILGNSLTSLPDGIFYFCTSLNRVYIPNSVTEIDYGAFYGCTSLVNITVANDNPKYDSRDNCNAIIETETNFLIIGCKNTIIPNSVTVIFFHAFSGCCSSLTSITIPSSVTAICDDAFTDCSELTSVTCLSSIPPECYNAFPSEVTSQATLYVPVWSVEAYQTANNWKDFNQIVGIVTIDDFEVDGIYYRAMSENTVMVIQKPGEEEYYQGDVVVPDCVSHQDMQFTVTAIDAGAFEDCYELNSVVIGNAVESIGEEAFQGCTGLTSVTIGSGVTNIGAKAFNYCNVLQSVTCEGTVPPVMENSNCFSSAAYRRATLKVPRLFVDAYNAADYWYKFEQIEGFGSIGPGDVNADGAISITDVTSLIGLVLGSGEYNVDADLNNNGKLDIGDVTSLIVLVLSI